MKIMMKYTLPFAVTIISLVLAGCAANGPAFSEVGSAIPTLNSNKGRIYFYRLNPLLAPNAVATQIFLNGQDVGESRKGGFFFVDVPPGPVAISTETEVIKRLSFSVEAGQVRYVRTSTSFGLLMHRVFPELIEKDLGEKEMAETVYLGRSAARNR